MFFSCDYERKHWSRQLRAGVPSNFSFDRTGYRPEIQGKSELVKELRKAQR
jgi:hypothetical protein